MSQKKHYSIILLFIVVITFIVWGNTLNNGFVYDDRSTITANVMVKQWKNLPYLFNRQYFILSGEYSYRPMVTLSYFLDYSVWKLDPRGYHFTNLVLHTVNAVLVFSVAFLIFKRLLPAAAAGLLFACHPVAAEAVNAVSFREDLHVLMFCLLSFFAYLRFSRSVRGKTCYYLFSLISFILALPSKEMAVTLPLFILLYDYSFVSSSGVKEMGKKIAVYVPYFIILGLYFLVYFFLMRNPESVPIDVVSPYHRALTMIKIFVLYFRLLLFPVKLTAEYTIPVSTAIGEIRVLSSLAVLLLIMVLSGFTFRRWKAAFFGIGWFFLGLLPVMNIVPLGNMAAERYLYLPAFGFFVFAAALLKKIYDRKRGRAAVTLVFCLVLLTWSVLAFRRNPVWKDEFTLAKSVLADWPESPRFRNMMGNYYLEKGMYAEAVVEFLEALRIDPELVEAHDNLGTTYARMGKDEEALKAFRNALDLRPGNPLAHNNLGNLYLKQGKLEKALSEFRIAIEIDPYCVSAYSNLGITLAQLRRSTEALDAYLTAVRLDPDSARMRNNLANFYLRTGMAHKAILEYKKAVRLDPESGRAYNDLAVAYSMVKQFEMARRSAKKAKELGYPVSPELMKEIDWLEKDDIRKLKEDL